MRGGFEVSLDKVRMFGRHGVFEHETRDGNEFEINLFVRYDEPGNWVPDSIEHTVSYADLFEIVKKEMSVPRRLLETAVCSIARTIHARYPFCTEIQCRISKLTPPMGGFIGSASVSYRISR